MAPLKFTEVEINFEFFLSIQQHSLWQNNGQEKNESVGETVTISEKYFNFFKPTVFQRGQKQRRLRADYD